MTQVKRRPPYQAGSDNEPSARAAIVTGETMAVHVFGNSLTSSLDRAWQHHAAPIVTLIVVLVNAAAHLLMAPRVDLSPDEALYALYGLHPDWSYVDHPPVVGWLQACASSISQSEFSLRMFPIAIFVLLQVVLHCLCRELFPHESPWIGPISVLLLNTGAIFQYLSFALIPETPLLLLALLIVRSLTRAVRFNRLLDWTILGTWLGLAGLTKYTAIVIVVSVLLYLAFECRFELLLKPGPWVAALLSCVLVSPVIVWNFNHEWISFAYRFNDAFRSSDWSIERFVAGERIQLIHYGPAIFLGGMLSLAVSIVRSWHVHGVRLLVSLALPILVVFGEASGFREPLPHWTALGWLATVPLTSRLLCHPKSWFVFRIFVGTCATFGFANVVFVHLSIFSSVVRFEDYRYPESVVWFHGWRDIAERALQLQDQSHGSDVAVIFVHKWSLGPQIAWYARPERVQVIGQEAYQLEAWFGAPVEGSSGILVVPQHMDGSAIGGQIQSTLSHFDKVQHLENRDVAAGASIMETFEFFWCEGYRPVTNELKSAVQGREADRRSHGL